MSIGTWKDGGFEIEVSRWDHEIFGEGGKGGLLNKKLVRAIRLLLDYSNCHDADEGSFVYCHTLDFRDIGEVSHISRQTLSRRVRELENLTIVSGSAGLPFWIRDNWRPYLSDKPGRKGRFVESKPINRLTIIIDMKNLPELLGRKKTRYGHELVSLEK